MKIKYYVTVELWKCERCGYHSCCGYRDPRCVIVVVLTVQRMRNHSAHEHQVRGYAVLLCACAPRPTIVAILYHRVIQYSMRYAPNSVTHDFPAEYAGCLSLGTIIPVVYTMYCSVVLQLYYSVVPQNIYSNCILFHNNYYDQYTFTKKFIGTRHTP